MTQLLPCPECGHIPDATDPDFYYPVDRSHTVFFISCYDGGSDSCDFEILTKEKTLERAIIVWNETSKGL